jgi:hypothetical protein
MCCGPLVCPCAHRDQVLVRPIRVPTDIKDTASLPRAIVRDYQRMLSTAPGARISPSTFLQVHTLRVCCAVRVSSGKSVCVCVCV